MATIFAGSVLSLAFGAIAASASATVPITALAFSPDGAALVSNGPRRVDIRSPTDGAVQGHLSCDLPKITALMFHPSGEILGMAGGEPGVSGEARLIDWRSRTVRQRFTNAQDLATGMAFNAAGTLLGVASADHNARVWRRADANAPYREAFTLSGHAGPVLAIAFSPTGRTIVTASADRSIKVWSTDEGRLLRTFSHHLEAVNALSFRPLTAGAAGAEAPPCACASASDDRTVRIWQPEIGRMVRIIRQHRAPVLALAYALDGRSVFSAGKEGLIRRFDADSDTLLSDWPAQTDWIYALAISPDGSKIASGDWSGKIQLHDLPGQK
ncbi:MAG TPA: WD40 repeat domain-containing protein [Verrucomicrobiae bacterium]